MVLIDSGSFLMGRTKDTADDKTNMRPMILRDDRPVHKVDLDAFYIDKFEVTQGRYAEFVKATGHKPPYHWQDGKIPQDSAQYPVYNVSWDDASAYCKWAGKRLPTEAEWEKAARGKLAGKDFPNGDTIAATDARYNTPYGPGDVGKSPANGYGLFDMAGSAAEWCSDWFERDYYEKGPSKNPQGPATGKYKIVRGGGWPDGPRRLTVFFRNWVRPNQQTPNIGFRCAQ